MGTKQYMSAVRNESERRMDGVAVLSAEKLLVQNLA